MKEAIQELGIRTLLLASLFILCISIYVNHRLKNARRYALAAKIPGPPTLPFIGNAHYFIGLDMAEFLVRLLALEDQFGSPQRFWLGSDLWVALTNPKDIEAVFTSEYAVNKSPNTFFKSQQNGIIAASGDKWRSFRKLLNPSFHIKLLERFVPIFNMQSKILVEELAHRVGEDAFDMREYASRCTLDMVCGTQMGVKTNEQIVNTSDFCNNLFRSTEIIYIRTLKLFLHPDFIFKLTSFHQDNQDCLNSMHKFTKEVIIQRMRALAKEGETNERYNIDLDSDKKRSIYLDTMLESFSSMDLDDLVLTVVDMLIAGSDTSGVTLSFTLLMLAMHPEYQEKVYQEQCDLFPNLDSPATMDDLNQMKYLEMVIKESLRICGPPAIIRRLSNDLKIENYILPSDTNVYLGFYSTHRDEKYWKYPNAFHPDHFTPEEIGKRPKFSFTPFSMGSRNCPGHKYALLSMKSAISNVIRRYELTTTLKWEDLKYKISFMLEPVQGYHISVHTR